MVLGNLRGGLSFWNSSNTLGFNEVSDARSFFSLYPNPATTSVDLVLNAPPAKGSTWVIRNNMGQLVQQQQALQQQTQVNISALHEGIYLVRLEGAKRGPAEHLIVLR